MAKKEKVTEMPTASTSVPDDEALTVVLEASYELSTEADNVKLDTAAAEAAIKFAQENDEFNIWEPQKDEAKIVRFLACKQVQQPGHVSYLATLHDYTSGGKVRTWLGEHVLKKIAENKLHETGGPFCLTYKGKVLSKKFGKEANAWNLYVYTADERRKLFAKP